MSRLFSKFPTVNDLLESAPLKAVVDRVGKNQVVNDTARYLDRLRQQAQSAAQQALHISTHELASRVARWITSAAPSGQRSVLNATGVLLPSNLQGPPLATEAIDAMAHASSAYQLGDSLEALSLLVNRLAGTEATMVFPSASAAHLAATTALSQGKKVIVRRGEIERDSQEMAFDEVAQLAGAQIKEVGSVNETSLSDYQKAICTATALLVSISLRHSSVEKCNVPGIMQLGALAKSRGIPLLADLGWSSVSDVGQFGLHNFATLQSARESGADLIVARGHGCLGGPRCGILTGRRDLIERVAAHAFAKTNAASACTVAALAATLQLHEDAGSAHRLIPLLSLLSTPAENLKLRAERLAPQLAVLPQFSEAIATAMPATLADRAVPSHALPGWGVSLKPAQGTAADFVTHLLAGPQSLAAHVEGDRVLLNLRSLSPRYDLSLIDALGVIGGAAETAE